MVIGKRFAWGHVGKTGGDATLAMFQVFPRLIVRADSATDPDKHATFLKREREVRGKQLVLNLRRLPSWLLSRAQHESRYGLYPKYEPLPMASADEIAEREVGDYFIRKWTADGRFRIDHWLRMERLQPDFLEFVGRFTDVTPEQRRLVEGLGLRNSMEYDHDVRNWFTPDQIRRMYERNPLWAEVETSVYGNLWE
jgi:hypothetical protein